LANINIRMGIKNPDMTARSLLLYGPKGTGKSMLARAIATEAGACFFDISPAVIDGKFPHPKTGGDLLVYTVHLVAQDNSPSVIYIDEVEKVYIAGKKKKGGAEPDNPNRIKKALSACIKTQIKRGDQSTAQDQILFIGCTSQPFSPDPLGPKDQKDLISDFDFKVWLSFPDYGSRMLLLRKFMDARINELSGGEAARVDPAALNLSSLAIASEGYSAGSLKLAVNRVLTARRVTQLKPSQRPLAVQEFLGPLSRTNCSLPENWVAFRDFDHEASGEKERIEQMQDRLHKLEGGAGDAKKR